LKKINSTEARSEVNRLNLYIQKINNQ
jgi:hypothetical protein